jgi:hypothetical protein
VSLPRKVTGTATPAAARRAEYPGPNEGSSNPAPLIGQRRIVALLFFLSGATALIYEIVWIRLFSISFGNTAQAMSTVLSVFLGGIAAGAAGARRLAGRPSQQCLRLYGFAALRQNPTGGPSLGHFPESHKFGPGCRHALSFEQ